MGEINFDIDTYKKFMRLLEDKWNTEYGVYRVQDGIIEIHTGGWSENEEALPELERTFYWGMAWQRSDRGGHYYLKVIDFKIESGAVSEKLTDPDDAFFVKCIMQYNDAKEYYNHYVRYGEEVMHISWDKNRWEYTIAPLEPDIREKPQEPEQTAPAKDHKAKTIKPGGE